MKTLAIALTAIVIVLMPGAATAEDDPATDVVEVQPVPVEFEPTTCDLYPEYPYTDLPEREGYEYVKTSYANEVDGIPQTINYKVRALDGYVLTDAELAPLTPAQRRFSHTYVEPTRCGDRPPLNDETDMPASSGEVGPEVPAPDPRNDKPVVLPNTGNDGNLAGMLVGFIVALSGVAILRNLNRPRHRA